MNNKLIEIQKKVSSLKHFFNEKINLIQAELEIIKQEEKEIVK